MPISCITPLIYPHPKTMFSHIQSSIEWQQCSLHQARMSQPKGQKWQKQIEEYNNLRQNQWSQCEPFMRFQKLFWLMLTVKFNGRSYTVKQSFLCNVHNLFITTRTKLKQALMKVFLNHKTIQKKWQESAFWQLIFGENFFPVPLICICSFYSLFF